MYSDFRLTATWFIIPHIIPIRAMFYITKKPVNTDVYKLSLTPRVGLEPTTPRLTAVCSTIELSRIIPFFFLSRLPGSSSSPLPHTYDTPTDSSARASHVPSKLHTRNFQPTLSFHLCLSPSPWSCPRPISCGQLHTLLYFHLRPIYLVVFKGSYYFRRDISS